MDNAKVKTTLTHISAIYEAHSQIEFSREWLKNYIRQYPLSGHEKEKLFGWGLNNYGKKLNEKYHKMPDSKLIEAAEKLLELK